MASVGVQQLAITFLMVFGLQACMTNSKESSAKNIVAKDSSSGTVYVFCERNARVYKYKCAAGVTTTNAGCDSRQCNMVISFVSHNEFVDRLDRLDTGDYSKRRPEDSVQLINKHLSQTSDSDERAKLTRYKKNMSAFQTIMDVLGSRSNELKVTTNDALYKIMAPIFGQDEIQDAGHNTPTQSSRNSGADRCNEDCEREYDDCMRFYHADSGDGSDENCHIRRAACYDYCDRSY